MPILPFLLKGIERNGYTQYIFLRQKDSPQLSFWRRESRKRAFPAQYVYNYIVLLSNKMFNMV